MGCEHGLADVVVACVAGFGAWGAKVTVAPNPAYASELFGAGHAAITYPDGMTPMVVLTIPQDDPGREAAGADTPNDDTDDLSACAASDHSGSAQVTFTLLAGMFDGNISGLMWDPIAGDGAATASRAAPASVATIESGGRKGDSSITIEVKEATNTAAAADADTARSSLEVTQTTTPGDACATRANQTISFSLPKLAGLDGALAHAHAGAPVKTVWARAESRIISGAFSNGFITGGAPHYRAAVVTARDSLTLAITPKAGTKTIAIKDDAAKGLTAFKSVKEKNAAGYVELATVTVTTKQMASPAMPATKAKHEFNLVVAADNVQAINTVATPAKTATFHELLDLDGEPIDEGLRGTLTVNAMGTRDLFNEDDMLFIDYDNNGKMGRGEAIEIDGMMGMGDALSVDPDRSESFDKGGTGTFKVYYMPGGKGDINHGAMINLTAMVDYSDPTANDEAPMKSSTTLSFDGVTSEVDAYAIPQSGNGKGDMANVRVRCEAAAGCRVFLECWDDDGMRSFGEAGMIAGNSLAKWDSMAIEGVIGVEDATSRHSCRILSAGMVKVQQLTRDGSSGTLVNNTYIGE